MNTHTKRRIDKHFFSVIGVVFLFCCISCASLQTDRLVASADDSLEVELTELAYLIVPLDRNPDIENIQKARAYIDELEARKIEETLFRAQLASWSGRLFLIEGLKKNAEKAYKSAYNIVSVDPAVIILAARLETLPETKLAILEKGSSFTDNTALIDIEKAIVFCELGRWSEAVSAFDTAFTKLPAVYRGTYADDRQNAWNLRSLDSRVIGQTTEIAAKQAILWKDAIALVQAETTLFSFITEDSVWTTEKIAHALYDKNLVPKNDSRSEFLQTRVSRSDAAYFLWHIHASRQNTPALLTHYSSRYKNMRNPESPISDIGLSDIFFDSVLGCIEWEFMSLPDGRSFKPNDPLKGSVFLQMIQKIQAASR